MPINRRSKSPRKSLHNLLPGGHGSLENVPPLPNHKHHLTQSPANGAEHARIQLSPLSNNELNGTSRQPSATPTSAAAGFTAVNSGGFTAVNNASMKREPSRDGSRPSSREPQHASPLQRDARTYTSPYDTSSSNATAAAQHVADSPSVAPTTAPVATPSTAASFPTVNPSTDVNGTSHRGSPATQNVHHAPIALHPQQQPYSQPTQPAHSQVQTQSQAYAHQQAQARARELSLLQARGTSRASSPGNHHIGRSLAPHPSSRSNTPHAPAASNQPPPASNAPIAPTPAVQTAHAYGMTLVPTQPAPAAPSNHLPQQQPAPAQHQSRHQPVLKSQVVEAPPAAQRPAAVPVGELRVLQCEVTAMLLHWLFPKPSLQADEHALLQRINTLWYHGESIFRPELGSHYDLTSHVLTAWLQERYAITSLQHALTASPGLPSTSSAIIDRLLAMNDLRAMRLKWKNMSPVDGMSPEDILVRAFCAMTMTEHTEFVFKEGLSRVERGVFEFLRTEDAKIVMHRR